MKITEEQIRSRPVVLDLKYGANTRSLHYTISTQYGYEKLMSMTAKQAVEFVLENHENRDPEDSKLEKIMKAFIENEKDRYTICTPTGTLVCEVDGRDRHIIKTDNRHELIKDYLEDLCDAKGMHVWGARMHLLENTHYD